MVEEISINDIDPRLRKQVDTASKAIDSGNAAQAVNVSMAILAKYPGCYEVRRILRKAQARVAQEKKIGAVSKLFASLGEKPKLMKIASFAKKDPGQAIQVAEDVVNKNPTSVAALKLIGEIATENKMPQTAITAYEAVYGLARNDIPSMILLGRAYVEARDAEKAIGVAQRILQISPMNEEAQSLLKDASIAATMFKGDWEKDASFRDKLKDSDEAVKLEQKSRLTTDRASLEQLIAEKAALVEQDPENIGHYRDIASYYKSMGELEASLQWIQAARQTPLGTGDTSLEKEEFDLQSSIHENKIADASAKVEANPNDEATKAALEEAKKDDHKFRIEYAKLMVEKYPNDYGFRYELGTLLFDEGNYDEAIKQFQYSQRNPKVRSKSLLFLGRAYLNKRFYDLAAESLLTAQNELPIMNEMKKEITYELASSYEQMGKMEEAITQYKVIYGADIGYRDVAKKIDDFYTKKSS